MELFRKIAIFFYDGLQTILLIAAVFLVLYIFVVQPHEVSGHSMDPTFNDHDFLLSNLLAVRFKDLKNGDIVVFKSPIEADKLYIKRIIGMPGDRVKVQDGKVYLNGAMLDESPYLKSDVMTYGGASMQDGIEYVVPEGTVVVMGDNRPNSSDSRAWGFLDEQKLIGKSSIRMWPVNTFEFIHNPFK
jgi:signal peptidase I